MSEISLYAINKNFILDFSNKEEEKRINWKSFSIYSSSISFLLSFFSKMEGKGKGTNKELKKVLISF